MPAKLTQAVAKALQPGKRTVVVYDNTLPGFGLRITKAGSKSWIVEYRPGGGRSSPTRRITLGNIATLPADKAAPTVSQLAERFLQLEGPTWKPRTRGLFAFYFRKFVLPEIGSKRARDVTHADIVRLHRKIGEQAPPTANRIVSLLRMMFNWASRAKDVPAGHNPARDVRRFKEQGKQRFLSTDELARLGEALREAETIGIEWEVDETGPKAKHAAKKESRREVLSPFAVGAIRLLLFTGCRRSEILTLRWEHVDFERGMFLLADAKAGSRYVLLSAPALAVLDGLARIRVGSYVIAGDDPDHPRADLNRPWRAIVKRGGLAGTRLHDLRHSFASMGAAGNLGLPVIGKLLGHKAASTTSRYSHLGDDPVRRASEAIGAALSAAMAGASGEVVPLRKGRRRS
jgi:integrase